MKHARARHTIRGVIVPAGWDDNGRVNAVSVQTNQEEEYLVVPNADGLELFDLIHSTVELNGIIKHRLDGRRTIAVKRYDRITGGTDSSV